MLTVTHSSIECFRSCHRKYFYEYDECIKPRTTPWPLLDGRALHLGLEWLYLNRTTMAMGEGKNALLWPTVESLSPIIWSVYEKERGGESGEEVSVAVHAGTVVGMLQGYVQAYPPNEFEEFRPEVKGECNVANPYMETPNFLLKFKCDGIVKRDSSPYLFETKTTSANDMARFLDSLGLDDQPDTYLYGFRKLGEPVLGVIYNVIRKPRFKQSKYESDEGFVKRIQKALIEDAKKLPAERKYYFRENIYRSEAELQKYEEEIRQVTSDMEAYMSYRCPKRCGESFGRKCDFLPLCQGLDVTYAFKKKAAQFEEYLAFGSEL